MVAGVVVVSVDFLAGAVLAAPGVDCAFVVVWLSLWVY